MTRPTNRAVAIEAAKYVVNEFKGLESWLSYEDELADIWLADRPTDPFGFTCAIDYVVPKVMDMIKWNKGMQGYAKYHPSPIAYVAGHVIGEWTRGHTSLDRELGSW